jgi:hypothetical protein
LKQEPSFVSPFSPLKRFFSDPGKQNFDDFSFDNVASTFSPYDCDPLSIQGADPYHESQYNQRLTIDTSFMDGWASSLSPQSPETPDYLMTPSPVINSSPVPSYASGYGGSFDDVLEKSFGDPSSHFSIFDSPSCGVQQTMSIYDGDNNHSLPNAETESLYNVFGDRYLHDTHLSPTDLDLEFSAFMNSVPQYAA